MFGIISILIAYYLGNNLLKKLLPEVMAVSNRNSIDGMAYKLSNWMVYVPASYLIGTLLITWVTYILAYVFRSTGNPMLWGNICSLTVFIAAAAFICFKKRLLYSTGIREFKKYHKKKLASFFSKNMLEILFTSAAVVTASFLMFYTFFIKGDTMYVGNSVWSDFGPHLSIIRSFSWGANFPTQYPHFAAGNIRYHFLFQFLVGNLEFLGLRLDWAFNLPSILSLVSFLMLLYSLSVILSGKPFIGILASVLFFFRSSLGFFTFLNEVEPKSLNNILSKMLSNSAFVGKTTNENWGLWNQNVYANQRHLAFSLAILLLILIVLLPLFTQMLNSLKRLASNPKVHFKKHVHVEKSSTSNIVYPKSSSLQYMKRYFSVLLFEKEAWLPQSLTRAVFIGIVLGLISFWNGAVVFAALPILFFMALLSKHRLEYLIIAIITFILSVIESSVFIGSAATTVKPEIYVGFLAAKPNSLISILSYYTELLGILPYVLLIGLFALPKGHQRLGLRYLTFAFLSPLFMATTMKFTPDINANHKFVIISVILVNIVVAYILNSFFKSNKVSIKTMAIAMVFFLTITGVEDFITLKNINGSEKSVAVKINDPVTLWVSQNTNPDEIFLTEMHVLDPILLAGRKLFFGWPYYAWSAGYDTNEREKIYKQIYGGTDEDKVRELVQKNNIRYIVVEEDNRNSKKYKLNESLIKKTFKLVYEDKQKKLSIYKTF